MSSCNALILLALSLLVNLKRLWLDLSEDAVKTNYQEVFDLRWLSRDRLETGGKHTVKWEITDTRSSKCRHFHGICFTI